MAPSVAPALAGVAEHRDSAFAPALAQTRDDATFDSRYRREDFFIGWPSFIGIGKQIHRATDGTHARRSSFFIGAPSLIGGHPGTHSVTLGSPQRRYGWLVGWPIFPGVGKHSVKAPALDEGTALARGAKLPTVLARDPAADTEQLAEATGISSARARGTFTDGFGTHFVPVSRSVQGVQTDMLAATAVVATQVSQSRNNIGLGFAETFVLGILCCAYVLAVGRQRRRSSWGVTGALLLLIALAVAKASLDVWSLLASLPDVLAASYMSVEEVLPALTTSRLVSTWRATTVLQGVVLSGSAFLAQHSQLSGIRGQHAKTKRHSSTTLTTGCALMTALAFMGAALGVAGGILDVVPLSLGRHARDLVFASQSVWLVVNVGVVALAFGVPDPQRKTPALLLGGLKTCLQDGRILCTALSVAFFVASSTDAPSIYAAWVTMLQPYAYLMGVLLGLHLNGRDAGLDAERGPRLGTRRHSDESALLGSNGGQSTDLRRSLDIMVQQEIKTRESWCGNGGAGAGSVDWKHIADVGRPTAVSYAIGHQPGTHSSSPTSGSDVTAVSSPQELSEAELRRRSLAILNGCLGAGVRYDERPCRNAIDLPRGHDEAASPRHDARGPVAVGPSNCGRGAGPTGPPFGWYGLEPVAEQQGIAERAQSCRATDTHAQAQAVSQPHVNTFASTPTAAGTMRACSGEYVRGPAWWKTDADGQASRPTSIRIPRKPAPSLDATDGC
ncbi:unnamed protein product [Parajaminaea phylloscopi]